MATLTQTIFNQSPLRATAVSAQPHSHRRRQESFTGEAKTWKDAYDSGDPMRRSVSPCDRNGGGGPGWDDQQLVRLMVDQLVMNDHDSELSEAFYTITV